MELSLQNCHFMCQSLFIYKSACLSLVFLFWSVCLSVLVCLSFCFSLSLSLCSSVSIYTYVLGWPKSLFGFFCNSLWKNWKECFGQPNIRMSVYMYILFLGSALITNIPGVTRACCLPSEGGEGKVGVGIKDL